MKKLSIFCGALLVLCTTFILNSCNEEDNPLMRVQVKSKTVCAEKLVLLLDEARHLPLFTDHEVARRVPSHHRLHPDAHLARGHLQELRHHLP